MDRVTWLDELLAAQASPEVTANDLMRATSPTMLGARRQSTTSGLTWGWYGGRIYVDGAAVDVGSTSHVGTTSLTNNATNYLEISRAGAISANTTGYSADKCPLYTITTSSSIVVEYLDHRDFGQLAAFFAGRGYGRGSLAMADANQTLAFSKAILGQLELTGALGALRDVIVPSVVRQRSVFANVTGGFGVRFKTSGGSLSVTVADGKRAIIDCDGSEVYRVTPDT